VSDWQQWHTGYDDPDSSLSRRLEVVRCYLAEALSEMPEPVRLISLCSGDGRDTIPVVADSKKDVDALLVELDPALADAARRDGQDKRVPVLIRTADAGLPTSFSDHAPASIFMLCGIFGNISDADIDHTIGALAAYLEPGALVIWTRGDHETDGKTAALSASERVRRTFVDHGYEEVDFTRPDDATYRVGMHRWSSGPATARPTTERLFRFLW
jgi:hypothetical protein